MTPQRSTARRPTGRNGSVLVEFAFIALAFYLLFAGTIELGRMITTAQAVQNAARVGARELALVALPPTATFRQALADPDVRARIYDERLLAVPTFGGVVPNTDGWPIINRMLTPLMIMQTVGGIEFYHYPGAVVHGDAGEYSVMIPEVVDREGGFETIRWHHVVEEVLPSEGTGPFSLTSTGPERGLVALRIHCPYQAATMSAFRTGPDGIQIPILADDAGVATAGGDAPPAAFVGTADDVGAYAGQYGLGRLYALGQEVRPFRRLISAQSLFRREVYR